MTVKELDSIINKILFDISTINTSWVIWNGLSDELKQGGKYMEILEYSPCFWGMTLDNFLYKSFIGLAKLYDEHKDCVGLKKLINICEQNQILFPQENVSIYGETDTREDIVHREYVDITQTIQVAKLKYQSVQDFREKLILLRDKYLAHSDKQIFLDIKSLYNEIAVKKENIDALIQTAGDIANAFLSNLSNTAVNISFDNAEDYKNLLRCVKDGGKFNFGK